MAQSAEPTARGGHQRGRLTAMACACFAAMATQTTARAAQTTVTISVASPAAAAAIHGSPRVATVPGSPFLYTVAASGTKPIAFSATGLPPGLMVDANTGQITGTVATPGTTPVMLHVSNAAGSDDKSLVIVAGTQLAQTPPMGWNSYDSYGASVTESEVMAAATAQASQLQPFGWNYVVIDYLWFDPEKRLDPNGRYLPSLSKFPSATGTLGFKPLADKIHAMGLNFGIHIMRGIPRSAVAANLPIANSTFTTSNAGNTSDACPWDAHMWGVTVAANGDAGQAWYDSIFSQYASWGIDFVKVDDMLKNNVPPLVYHQSEADAIRRAIDKTGRSIVFSLSPGPMQVTDSANLAHNANMWRMVNDFWDIRGLSTLTDVFNAGAAWQKVTGLAAGQWPDADMLPLGDLAPRCPVHASGPTALTHNEQVTVMSYWAILPSPLMFGGNVPSLTTDTTTGPWTTALLTNDEVLAVNQDSLGTHGKQILSSGNIEVWARDVSGGRKAVALFNHGAQDAIASITFAQLGMTGAPAVRDLWQRTNLPGMTSALSVNVPWNAAALLMLTPTSNASDAGAVLDGGGSSSGSGSGSGSGSTDAGGSSGGSSGSGSGGSSASGGSSGDGGGSGGSGASASSGSGGGASGGGAAPAPASQKSGCACGLGAGSGASPGWALLGVGPFLRWVRRRRT